MVGGERKRMEGKQWNHEQTMVSRVCDISLRRSENGKDTFKTVLIKRGKRRRDRDTQPPCGVTTAG